LAGCISTTSWGRRAGASLLAKTIPVRLDVVSTKLAGFPDETSGVTSTAFQERFLTGAVATPEPDGGGAVRHVVCSFQLQEGTLRTVKAPFERARAKSFNVARFTTPLRPSSSNRT